MKALIPSVMGLELGFCKCWMEMRSRDTMIQHPLKDMRVLVSFPLSTLLWEICQECNSVQTKKVSLLDITSSGVLT